MSIYDGGEAPAFGSLDEATREQLRPSVAQHPEVDPSELRWAYGGLGNPLLPGVERAAREEAAQGEEVPGLARVEDPLIRAGLP